MKIVIDSNVAIALVVELPYSDSCMKKITSWHEDGQQLIAPTLWLYEIASVIRKFVALNKLSFEEGEEALKNLLALGITIKAPNQSLILNIYEIAEKIGQKVAYDAAFLALAQQEKAQFWTADQKLVRAAKQAGYQFVHYIEE